MSKLLRDTLKEEKDRKTATPQHERTPGRTDEVKNNAGGYVFKVTDRTRLQRFLILGAAGNTYYVDAKAQAKDNIKFLRELVERDSDLVLEVVKEISLDGRAFRQDATLLAVAALLCYGTNKAAVVEAFPSIVRTATHLYTVCENIESLGGWGAAKRKAVSAWFNSKTPEALALQAVKYRSRTV